MDSVRFIETISGGCENCKAAWQSVLLVKKSKKTPYQIAAKELSKELPDMSKAIVKLLSSLEQMPVEDILDRTPKRLRGIIGFVMM